MFSPRESITVTESTAELKLQALLEHTASSLLEVQKDVFVNRSPEDIQNLTLILKWGFDGSAQSEYKQMFTMTQVPQIQIFSSHQWYP